MSTKICFTYNDRDYVLEYTKETIKQMESHGFVASRITEAPMTVLPDLFAGAFLANHKFTNRKIIDEIYGKMLNKSELIDTLSQMYSEPIKALTEDSGDEGNGIMWAKE